MTENLQERAKTGIERFYDRYPDYPRIKQEEYLGIGAMMIPLSKLIKYDDKR